MAAKEPRQLLKSLLLESGAVAFGVAEAAPVDEETWERFQRWLEGGHHAGMEYMERWQEIRRDPRLLLDGAKSIVSIAYNYRQPNPWPGLIATYALGEDYHKVLRRRLKRVVTTMKAIFGAEWRVCIDSAPILERYWAEKAGVGKRHPVHGNIVVDGVGSMVFLAEIITTLEIEQDVVTIGEIEDVSDAGCRRCPTGALQPGGEIDARKCINYLTIEKIEPLNEEEVKMKGKAVFGCECCLVSSPENAGDCPNILPEFFPIPGLGDFLHGETNDFDLAKSPLSRKFKKH